MEFVELSSKSPDELKELLENHRRERFNLRFQKASGELEKTHRMRIVRRTIARIQTMLNNPALATAAAPKAKKAAKKKEK
jgi:large subunit ribosomal protein L29